MVWEVSAITEVSPACSPVGDEKPMLVAFRHIRRHNQRHVFSLLPPHTNCPGRFRQPEQVGSLGLSGATRGQVDRRPAWAP